MDTTEIENKAMPVKKKRGRPFGTKKVKKESMFDVIDAQPPPTLMVQTPVKKKRGRPFGTTKKNTQPEQPAQKGKYISESQYWKFRGLGLELTLAEQKQKVLQLGLKNLEREAELIQSKMQTLKGDVSQNGRKEIEEARSAFQKFKDELEATLGMSLNGAAIDEETFEVKTLVGNA